MYIYICFDFSESEERSESAGDYMKTITFLDIYIYLFFLKNK